jgi:integrase
MHQVLKPFMEPSGPERRFSLLRTRLNPLVPSGMQLSELLGLTWADVDLDEG